MLFLRVKGEIIKFATFLKNQQNCDEKRLISDTEKLERLADGHKSATLLEDKNFELENIRKQKVKGHIIRSGIQWLSEGEKSTSCFYNLENRNFVEETVKNTIKNGEIITKQSEILKEISKFYSQLFKNQEENSQHSDLTKMLNTISKKKILMPTLGYKLTVDELSNVLKNKKL